jgi:TonB-linked SusC/RagA family outer membrane protein
MGDDGFPVIGATVVVKGNTSIGTVTDFDGNFSLSVPEGTKTLVISYVGFQTEEVAAKTGSEIKVTLSADTQVLDEVVVTGMQKMDKRLFTGSTTQLDAEDTKLDGVADVSRALEGKAAGVSVQNVSGTFGAAPKIRVRGATSIYGSSTPLWVVDGVILENAVDVDADDLSSGDATSLISSAIAGLNADDIESFQVLKDGSATSIYGARAMAGVVVVTTKRGKAGVSTINYTGEFTTRMKPNYNNYNISNSQEQMSIYKEMEEKGWLNFSSLASSSSSGVYGKMYQLMRQYNETNGQFGLANTQAAMNKYLQTAEKLNTDWFDLLFRNSLQQNHAVSISGGTEKAKLYASLSALYDPGWTKKSAVERYTGNLNASFDVSKWVTLTLLTSASYRNQEAPGTLSQSTDVVSGAVSRSFDINPYSFALNTSRTLDPNATYSRNYASFNIFDELDNNYIQLGVTDMKFQGELNWKPILGLEFHALVAYRYQSSTNEHFIKDHSNQAEAYRAGVDNPIIMYSNPYLYTDPDDPNANPVSVMPEGGMYFRSDYSVKQLDFRGTVQYNKVIQDGKHIINLFGGMESNKTDKNQVDFEGWGFIYDEGGLPAMDPSLFKQMKEEGRTYYANAWGYTRSLAYFLTGNYSYKGKYNVNLTGRYEGTNKLGRSRSARWLPTWNVGASWNVHEENWFYKQPVFSHMTLRASYSLVADRGPSWVTNALPVYYATQAWKPEKDLFETGIVLSDLANSELTYEKKYEFNVGADVGFLDNRINLVFDYYTRNNYDLIGDIYTQGAGGFIHKYGNVASMKSHGFEFTLSTRNIQTKDFSWSTDWTFSNAVNEITDLESRSTMLELCSASGYALEGYPVRAMFSIPFVGLNDEGLPQFINENGEVTTSSINFQEYEKLDHLVYEGPVDPTITGGFGNIFDYKNFRLNVFITYSFGNKIRLDPVFAAAYSDQTASPKEFKNRWTIPGDENKTTIPTIASRRQYQNDSQLSYAYNAYNYSTERVANGGFIRMKEISLTYTLPNKFVKRIGLSNASLKIQGTNLFLIYADKKLNGQDPEFVNSGGVATPMPKQFTFTLRLGI